MPFWGGIYIRGVGTLRLVLEMVYGYGTSKSYVDSTTSQLSDAACMMDGVGIDGASMGPCLQAVCLDWKHS